MEVTHYIIRLQTMLRQHDWAVRQILRLSQYIESINRQAFTMAMYGTSQQVMQILLRKSVAEGVKKMFKLYRLRKWLKVQILLQHRAHVMQTSQSDLRLHHSLFYEYPDLNILESDDQTVQGWAVMHCEFCRCN